MSIAKLSLVGAITALTLTSGCMDTLQDPSNPNRRAQSGALAGAALGAVIGASQGGDSAARTRSAILGAAIGAAGGGIIGYELDKQAAELRSQLGSNVGIQNAGDRLIVTMPQDILFATDSATLSGGLQADLQTLAASINRYQGSVVEVVGHTDNVGDASYNQALSERRAQAVSSVLISSGVAASRVRAYGRGESAPVANNLTASGRAANRRVEIVIIPQR